MPRDDMRAVRLDDKYLFIPMIAVNALYDWGDGRTGQTSKSYVVGRELAAAEREDGRLPRRPGPAHLAHDRPAPAQARPAGVAEGAPPAMPVPASINSLNAASLPYKYGAWPRGDLPVAGPGGKLPGPIHLGPEAALFHLFDGAVSILSGFARPAGAIRRNTMMLFRMIGKNAAPRRACGFSPAPPTGMPGRRA